MRKFELEGPVCYHSFVSCSLPSKIPVSPAIKDKVNAWIKRWADFTTTGACLKPHVYLRVPATRDFVERTFGHKIGQLFVKNPLVDEYAVVLRFPETKVIVNGEIKRALSKLGEHQGPVLLIARDLTVEARHTAANAKLDMIVESEFGWTDATYQAARQARF